MRKYHTFYIATIKEMHKMRSTDTLLDYVLRFMEAQNRVSDKRITPLEALKIYHEIVRAK